MVIQLDKFKIKKLVSLNFGFFYNFTKMFSFMKFWVSIYQNDSNNELIQNITLYFF